MTRTDPIAGAPSAIARHSRSFALASRLLPAPLRRDVAILYAWCRLVDDAVDDGPAEGAAERLRALRGRLASAAAGAPAGDPVTGAFVALLRRRRIPRAYPEALLQGMESDVAGARMRTLDDLLAYAYRVASTVGLMVCHIAGVRDDDALVPAAHLGIAMQLTNVCRDVAEDYARGRCYIPDDLLSEVGAPPLAPAPGARVPDEAAPALAAATARLLDLADRYYASADRGMALLDSRAGVAVRAARLLYAAIGGRIRRQGCDPRAGRAYVRAAAKAWLLLRALAAGLVAAIRSPARPPRPPRRLLLAAPAPAPGGARRGRRGAGLAGLAALVLAAATTPARAAAPPAAPAQARTAATAGTVVVRMTGFESDRGLARVALFTGPRGFPMDRRRVAAHASVAIKKGRAVARFSNVPAGPVAIVAFHDEDRDGRLDRGAFGIPTEAYGASRGARRRFGPPRFADARLMLRPGATLTAAVVVR